MRPAAVALLGSGLAACGDLDIRSVRNVEPVPAALAGEWGGTWRSSTTGRSGEVGVQVQQFAGEPLVQVDIDNPSVQPQVVEMVMTANTIELRSGGVVVMSAMLFQDHHLEGLFDYGGDRGTWSAFWLRELPPVLDLSGTWHGELLPLGGAAIPVQLELQQGVSAGQLRLAGLLDVPQTWTVPLEGGVRFAAGGFDLVLRSAAGSAVQCALSASGAAGDDGAMRLESGLLHVFGDEPVPFRDATLVAVRAP